MNTMPRLTDLTQQREMLSRAKALVAVAIGRDTWLSTNATESVRQKGLAHYFTKDADVLTTGDDGVALLPLASAFLGLINAESILGALDGILRMPVSGFGRLQVGTVEATTVAEGALKPIARIAFNVSGEPVKIAAQVVISAEALRAIDPATQAGITQVLVSACATQADVELLRVLTAGSPAASSAPGDLFAAVSGGNPRRPYLIGGFDALGSLAAGTVRDLQALGVVVLPCAAAAGTLIALDAAGLLVGDDTVRVETARHASMAIDFGGGSPTPMVSLWQSNLACLRAERLIKIALRSGAAAFASVGSPA